MALKSAWEISQEKAAAIDGRGEGELSLTEKQKVEIAEIRKEYDAKIAERDVMLQNKLKVAFVAVEGGAEGGAEFAQQLKEEFIREKQALNEERDARIEKARNA